MKNVSIHTYQQLIAKYKTRQAEYNKGINRKLKVWRDGIRRIKKRNDKIKKLIQQTNSYFKVNIDTDNFTGITSFARYCYYKYGLEHQVTTGKFLSDAIGRNKDECASKRRRLNRQFRSDPKKLEQYHKYKNHLESLP